MNAPALTLISAHRASSLGSNTTHGRAALRLRSRNRAVRRTGTYFHSLARASAPARVRVPKLTVPMLGKARSQLIPRWLILHCWRSDMITHGDADAAQQPGPAG